MSQVRYECGKCISNPCIRVKPDNEDYHYSGRWPHGLNGDMTSRVVQVISALLAAFTTAATIAASIESARSVAQLISWGVATVTSGMAVAVGCSLTSAARPKSHNESCYGDAAKCISNPCIRVKPDNEDYHDSASGPALSPALPIRAKSLKP